MSGRAGKRRKALAVAGAAIAVLAIAAACALLYLSDRAANPSPSPGGEGEPVEGDMWPDVDWDWWLSVNPDVIGWISIPGTSVSQPIVQAHPDDPSYYLSHDVYGGWNPNGAIYLDSECEGGLFGSPNAVLYGHHMGDGSMFTELASYADQEWAEGHATVLVQSPSERHVYEVRYAGIHNNALLPKRVSFDGLGDFRKWYEDGLASASAVVDAAARPAQAISLVTCSYTFFTNERTVAVCSSDEVDGRVIWADGEAGASADPEDPPSGVEGETPAPA